MHLTQIHAVIAASLLASGSIVVRSLESAIRQPLKGSTSSQYKRFDARCYGSFTLQPSHFTCFLGLTMAISNQSNDFYIYVVTPAHVTAADCNDSVIPDET